MTTSESDNQATVKDGEYPFYTQDTAVTRDNQGVVGLDKTDTIANYKVTTPANPSPNSIIPLDNNGRIPLSTLPSVLNTQSVVTGSRALGTIYHNTSTTPKIATVSVSLNGDNLQAIADSSAAPTTVVMDAPYNGGGSYTAICFFVILPGYYYKVTSTGTLKSWTEWS
jgi:hypothetical protein